MTQGTFDGLMIAAIGYALYVLLPGSIMVIFDFIPPFIFLFIYGILVTIGILIWSFIGCYKDTEKYRLRKQLKMQKELSEFSIQDFNKRRENNQLTTNNLEKES